MQIKKCLKLCAKLDGISIDELCEKFNLDKDEVYKINGTKVFNENDVILLPNDTTKIYVVKPLDTIEKIAQRLNVDTNDIVCATSGKIFVGQKIIL